MLLIRLYIKQIQIFPVFSEMTRMAGFLSAKGDVTNLKCNFRPIRYLIPAGTSVQRIRIFILLISGLLILNIPAYSQIRGPYKTLFETDLGFGFPESICLKLKIGNEIQVGLSQSFDTHGFGTTALEIFYRFGYKPRLLDLKPWYVMVGIDGYIFDVDYLKEYKLLVYPRIGRSLFFTKNTGINLEIGLGFPLGRSSNGSHLISPVVPTGNMGLFFRF